MAMHKYDYSTPLRRAYRRNASHHARRRQQEFDIGTLWAGAMLGAALAFAAYMMIAGPLG